jgi:hypothetical protein
VPLPTLSQEAVTQHFSFILPTSPYALTHFILIPPSFSLFQVSATQCHPPPSYATCYSTHSIHHHVALTTTTAAPSAHATKCAQPPPHSPPFCCALSHPKSFLHHCCLYLTMSLLCHTVSTTNTHLTAIALQCRLRTPSPLKIAMFNLFYR